MSGVRTVGLLGGGVIGGGWAARFLLGGSDVRLYDPDPEAERKLGEILELARRALGRLSAVPLPREGTLTVVPSAAAAAEGVELVQESAPERLELKQALLAEVCAAAGPEVLIASSTSGLRPTALAAEMGRPERFLVAHPFNPVYLLPLVELCGGERTSAAAIERAAELYGSLGMAPLVVRKEIDGFVADRMLEALWREALWLVHDGVATTAEVDDAIRLGAGLRWSSMGTFLTYRIAGGEAGMRHFMAQFGPALKWPWTKLMDVPELTDELLDTIVAQSDEQAEGRSVRELEQLRDDCLVGVLQALRARDVGAGAVLARHEAGLARSARARVLADADELSEPLALHSAVVGPDWVDYNGHAHESRYLQVFGDSSDALFAYLGIDPEYLEAGSYFTVESHLSHLREALLDDCLSVTTQVLDFDPRRLHVFHSLWREGDGALLATAEQLFLHVDTVARRAAPAEPEVLARVRRIAEAHATLPRPEQAGRAIAILRATV
ncbi:MAG TPA: carnitine 3-dehydrogenase [Gaiellales bacterium]|jgi:carnitine 3-dehydrogenase|nr:carnitine 3-dehydrogenase [Gaiellales bacterium]